VAAVAFARHDSWFTRAFEDLVVYDAICSSKLAATRRHGVSWRAVDHKCMRVAREALGRVDLLEGLVAIAIDEVKYNYVGDPVNWHRLLLNGPRVPALCYTSIKTLLHRADEVSRRRSSDGLPALWQPRRQAVGEASA
jgi:hypothetical protein